MQKRTLLSIEGRWIEAVVWSKELRLEVGSWTLELSLLMLWGGLWNEDLGIPRIYI